jgi:pimeloyl-ACP methyl ester carboxylesterase
VIHHEEAGAGEAVVLLHGGAMDLRMWDDQVPALARDHRVIRFDARGHGRSATNLAPFRQCDDVAGLLHRLGVERATLVGVSMGAGAATDTALEYPGLVSGLVVCGAGTNEPTFADPWMLDIQRRQMAAQLAGDAATWIDLFLQLGVVGPDRAASDVDPGVLARCREMITDTVRNHVRPDAVPPHHVRGSWARLGEISVPALGIVGSLDAPDHRNMVDRFVAAVPGARKVVIDGTAHVPNMERPAEFNDVLLAFLREADLSSGSGRA